MQTRSRLALAAALALAALPVVAASAADKPVPGCAGLAFEDTPGDSQNNAVPGAPTPGSPSLDVTGGFFREDDGNVTANIRVSNLTKDIPDGATGVDWYMVWTAGDKTVFVHASLQSGGDPKYAFGDVQDTQGNTLYNDTGETGGQFFEGKDGLVQITVPGELASGTFQSPNAQTFEDQQAQTPAVSGGRLLPADSGPDEGVGTDYAVGGCTGAAAAPAPAVAPPAPAAPSNQTAAPASSQPTMRVASKGGSARKATRAHKLAVTLQSSGPVSGVTGTLVDAKGKTVASGKLAKLNGKGTLVLRVRKALRKGRYTLRLTSSSGSQSAALTLTR